MSKGTFVVGFIVILGTVTRFSTTLSTWIFVAEGAGTIFATKKKKEQKKEFSCDEIDGVLFLLNSHKISESRSYK